MFFGSLIMIGILLAVVNRTANKHKELLKKHSELEEKYEELKRVTGR